MNLFHNVANQRQVNNDFLNLKLNLMNDAFNWCIRILEYYSVELGMTYKELNVWVFRIIEPIIFIGMTGYIFWLRNK